MKSARCIGRIIEKCGGVKTSRGTGFAIDETTVLTAFHCIRSRDDDQPTENELVLRLPDETELALEVLRWSQQDDVAVLRLADILPPKFHALRAYTGDSDLRGKGFQSEGFPSFLYDGDTFTVHGAIVNPEAMDGARPTMQLFVNQMLHEFDPRGMSGAPILVQTATPSGDPWVVVGVARSSLVSPESGLSGAGATLFGCPIGRVKDLWKNLLGSPSASGLLGNPISEVASWLRQPMYANLVALIRDPSVEALVDDVVLSTFSNISSWEDLDVAGQFAGMRFVRDVCAAWEAPALPLNEAVAQKAVGERVMFDLQFRTRGLGSYVRERGLSGDLSKDPVIYSQQCGVRTTMPIEPKWITTTTGRVWLSSGSNAFAGVGTLRSVDASAVLVSPTVLGPPVRAAQLTEAIFGSK